VSEFVSAFRQFAKGAMLAATLQLPDYDRLGEAIGPRPLGSYQVAIQSFSATELPIVVLSFQRRCPFLIV
jgi:hypothetical protein